MSSVRNLMVQPALGAGPGAFYIFIFLFQKVARLPDFRCLGPRGRRNFTIYKRSWKKSNKSNFVFISDRSRYGTGRIPFSLPELISSEI